MSAFVFIVYILPKPVKLLTLSHLKLPIFRRWKHLLACAEDISVYPGFFSLIMGHIFQPSISKPRKGRFTHSMPCPCRAAKSLECVFPIWFTQCGRVWFTLAMPRPCQALTIPFSSRPRHSTAVERRPCCVNRP